VCRQKPAVTALQQKGKTMSSSLLRELEQELGESTLPLAYEMETEPEFEIERFDPHPPRPGTTLLTRFAFASAALTAEHKRILARFTATLVARMPLPSPSPSHCLVLMIEGHEDEVGDPKNFGVTGLKRARAVRKELIKDLSARIRKLPAARRTSVLRQLNPRLIAATTAGPTRPIRSNVTAAGRALNRRVEIRVGFIRCRTVV
jgi:outer membrane protein OmpA-like peptidoglycan-associated protein